ncbi:amino acid transporter, putative [Perkinsus marinus ATCC 50983]|uniref:Amino acid transporter, putative n=1 Tax=Perkinsus marinus (strain ATCC 50983 / TXsc) TaxID=423536 RepID=C5LX78_PERM5|nr:amino acid transporter, putative [Perkinsus marinus ATCC 50983]EEQ98627.1 amino acid transporter, putative [Perkinsus marinus ATCC 50983]|eukprot:XP_002765910.1 amino acid transporter, putative [Perkinsus marinus ATCC 50983]
MLPINSIPDDGISVKPSGLGWFAGACTLTMTAIGVGILTLPGTATSSGWLGSVIGLTLATTIVFHNNLLLWRTLRLAVRDGNETAKCYEEAGGITFGTGAAIYFGFVLHVTLVAVCSVMFLLLASTCEAMARVFDRRVWIALWVLVGIPLSWIREVKDVGIIAAAGVLSATAMVVVIIAASANKLVVDGTAHDLEVGPRGVVDYLSVFATYFFAYGISATTPTVCYNMSKPNDFPKSLVAALGFSTLVYLVVMELGYAAYGQALSKADTIVGAISPSGQPLNVFGWLINLVVLLVVLSHFLVLFTPTAKQVDAVCSTVGERRRWSTFNYRIGCSVGRTCLVIFEGFIAIVVPKVDILVGLIGAFCVTQLSVFFPIACYIKIQMNLGSSIPKWKSFFFVLLMVVGLVVMGMGVYGAILNF